MSRIPNYVCLVLLAHLPMPSRAAADPDDRWRLFAEEGFTYDDNLFRLSGQVDPHRVLGPGMSKSDFMNRLGVGGRYNLALGRQRFLADVRVADNRFVHNTGLDNVSTADRLSWAWQLGRNWWGNLGYSYARALAPYAYTQLYLKDMVSEQDGFFDLNYAWHPRWKASAGFRWEDTSHGNPRRAYVDREAGSALFGLTYTTPAANSLGLDYRFTSVFLPNRHPAPDALVDNHYQVHTAGAAFLWHLTGKTELDGRFGYSTLLNRTFTQRDFAGPTWRIALHWDATAKTRLSLDTWRDLQPSQTLFASYMVGEGAGLAARWNATAKLSLDARLGYQSLDFAGGPPGLAPSVVHRRDGIWQGRVGVTYTPVRNLELGLAYQGEQRSSSQRYADFTDNSLFASIKLAF